MEIRPAFFVYFGPMTSMVSAAEIEPTWELMAERLTIQVPNALPDQPVIGFRVDSR